MRKMFERSEETARLVQLFRSMNQGQTLSWEDAAKVVGFRFGSSSVVYHTARRICERDFGVYIYGVRKFGFGRGTGSNMVDSGSGMFQSVRRKMRRCADRMLVAISENLDDDEHRRATDMFSRANIIADTAAIRSISNRPRPERGDKAEPFDVSSALKSIGKRKRG